METNYPYSILLICCVCLLCIVVLAIVVTVIVMAMKKRNQESPESLPPNEPAPPSATETVVLDDEEEATFIATSTPEPSEEPTVPEAPVEAYAAQTIISSSPFVEPTPEEKPANPFNPGSVAASSWNVGFDVRELYIMGFTEEEMHKFTQEEIQAVIDNVISLDELRKRYQDS